MANWNNPTLTSLYVDFLAELKARDTDVLTMSPGTNIPVGAKRWNSPTNTFQEWNGATWNNLILSGAGGGTGSGAFPALGTMAAQNSNAVAITGGTITGVALNAGDITSGILALNRGGTGASLALGPSGSMMGSSGAAVVFTFQGDQLVNLNASSIAVGTLNIARMPNGGTWANTVPLIYSLTGSAYVQMFGASLIMGAAGGGNLGNGTINVSGGYYINGVLIGTSTIPAGMMAYFSGACPAGWSFVAGSQGRTIRSINTGAGGQGGNEQHDHSFSVPAGGGGGVNSGPAIGEQSGGNLMGGQNRSFDAGSSFSGFLPVDNFNHSHTIGHVHNFNVPEFPGHNGATGMQESWPPYIDFSLCRKD